MRIQLERNLNASFHQFHCIVCQDTFMASQLRTLLSHDDGSIAGDVCRDCLKQGASHIQHQLKNQSIELCQQPLTDDSSLSVYRQALELSELAAQPLFIPPVHYWWRKRITLLAAETQELAMARREIVNCRYLQSKLPKITFLTEEPKISRDN